MDRTGSELSEEKNEYDGFRFKRREEWIEQVQS